MIPAPTWLPHRVRAAWDNRRIDRAAAGLARATPSPAADPARAAAELHMLVCGRDATIAGVALLSFLRHAADRLAVTLTDDGSLTPADRANLDRLVPNAHWLPRRSDHPAVTAALAGRPRLAALYAGGYHPICKLLHPVLLGRTERAIVLDPDTAVFRRPDLLLRWASGEDDNDYYLHDHQDENAAVPPDVRAAFARLAGAVTPPGRRWELAYHFFNSGLLAYRRGRMDLDVAEAYLAWKADLPENLRTGKAAIWFGDWTPEQTGYLAMFATAAPPPVPLTDDYWLGGGGGRVFNHFLRHYLIRSDTQRLIRDLVRTL